jgi:soluble lytic murein transglycosylase
MRLVCVLVAVSACSGDDSHRHPTSPARVESGTASAPGDAAPATADASTGPQLPQLSEAMVAPYWQSDDERAAAQAFALESWADARAGFERARTAAGKDADRVARIDLMIGLCAEKLGDADGAAAHLQDALAHLPQLADYIGYHAARALWLAHKSDAALALAKTIAPDSIDGPDAEILVGDLLHAAPDWPAIVKHYRDYLARRPSGPFRSEARFQLADALDHTGAAAQKESVMLLRQITIEDPLSSWATKASDRLKLVKKTAGKPLADAIDARSAADHLARGMVLFDAMRNPQSEAEFAAALLDRKITKAQRCDAAYHRAESRFKARDRKSAAPMFDDAAAACRAAKSKNLEIKSNYRAGISYSYLGQHDVAIARYQAVQTIDPEHSYADDGLLKEAEEWKALNNDAKVEETLGALPEKFPKGDMVPAALWRLGFHFWRAQKYDDAIKQWSQLAARGDAYDYVFGDFERGEAGYWLGRAYAAKKQLPEAIKQWQETARGSPAAFYALMSLNRLREASPKDFTALVAELQKDPPGYDPKAPAFVFKPRADWGTPGFLRAMELLRLGLGEAASHELKKVGLAAPSDRKRVDDPDRIEKLWAVAWLYDRAGRYASSHNPTRWNILDYRTQWPVGANRARWQIAYPRAYWDLLAKHAKLNNVPMAMQIGIVREESGFDPLDESYANAIGLTQMIPVTAKDFSKGTGIAPTRENLRDPEKNVTIGSRFLGSLYKGWNDFTLLVPTSYNAGPAGVRRMLRARGTWDGDEFVEGIIDDQARDYTKRVLGTYFTYSWLYAKEVPVVPNEIPKALLPK